MMKKEIKFGKYGVYLQCPLCPLSGRFDRGGERVDILFKVVVTVRMGVLCWVAQENVQFTRMENVDIAYSAAVLSLSFERLPFHY